MASAPNPSDRLYTKDHEWAKEDGSVLVIGITAFAVDQLGDITLVSLDVKVGDEVKAGDAFGTIESVKTLSDLYAPVSGKIVAINDTLEDQPELVNADPWDKGWMVKVEPADRSASAGLLDSAAYAAHVESQGH